MAGSWRHEHTSIERFSPPRCFDDPNEAAQYVSARQALRNSAGIAARQVFRPQPNQTALGLPIDNSVTLLSTEVNAMRWPPLCYQADAVLKPTTNVSVTLCRCFGRDPIVVEAEAKIGAIALLSVNINHSRRLLTKLTEHSLAITQFAAAPPADENATSPYLPELPVVEDPLSVEFRADTVERARETLKRIIGDLWMEVDALIASLDSVDHVEIDVDVLSWPSLAEKSAPVRAVIFVPEGFDEIAPIEFKGHGGHGGIGEALRRVLRLLRLREANELRERIADLMAIANSAPSPICFDAVLTFSRDFAEATLTWSLLDDVESRAPVRLTKTFDKCGDATVLRSMLQFIEDYLIPLPNAPMCVADRLLLRLDTLTSSKSGAAASGVAPFDLSVGFSVSAAAGTEEERGVTCTVQRDDGTVLATASAKGGPEALCLAVTTAAANCDVAPHDVNDLCTLASESLLLPLPLLLPGSIQIHPDVASAAFQGKTAVDTTALRGHLATLTKIAESKCTTEPPRLTAAAARGSRRSVARVMMTSMRDHSASTQQQQQVQPVDRREGSEGVAAVQCLADVTTAVLHQGANPWSLPVVTSADDVTALWTESSCKAWGTFKVDQTDAFESTFWSPNAARWPMMLLSQVAKAASSPSSSRPWQDTFPETYQQWMSNLVRPALTLAKRLLLPEASSQAFLASNIAVPPAMDRCRFLKQCLLDAQSNASWVAQLSFPTQADDALTLLGDDWAVDALTFTSTEVTVTLRGPKRSLRTGTAAYDARQPFRSVYGAIKAAMPWSVRESDTVRRALGAINLKDRVLAVVSTSREPQWLQVLQCVVKAGLGGGASTPASVSVRVKPEAAHAVNRYDVLVVMSPDVPPCLIGTGATEGEAIQNSLSAHFGVGYAAHAPTPEQQTTTTTTPVAAATPLASSTLPPPPAPALPNATYREPYLVLLKQALDCVTFSVAFESKYDGTHQHHTVTARVRRGGAGGAAEVYSGTDANPLQAVTACLEACLVGVVGDAFARKLMFAARRDSQWWGTDKDLSVYDATMTARKVLYLAMQGRVRFATQEITNRDRDGGAKEVGYSAVAKFSFFGKLEFDLGTGAHDSSKRLAINEAATNALHHTLRHEFHAVRAMRYVASFLSHKTTLAKMQWLLPPAISVAADESTLQFRATILTHPPTDHQNTSVVAATPSTAYTHAVDHLVEAVVGRFPELEELLEAKEMSPSVQDVAAEADDNATALTLPMLLRTAYEAATGTPIAHVWETTPQLQVSIVHAETSAVLITVAVVPDVLSPITALLHAYVSLVAPVISAGSRQEIRDALPSMLTATFSVSGRQYVSESIDALLRCAAEIRLVAVEAALPSHARWHATLKLELAEATNEGRLAMVTDLRAAESQQKKEAIRLSFVGIVESIKPYAGVTALPTHVGIGCPGWLATGVVPSLPQPVLPPAAKAAAPPGRSFSTPPPVISVGGPLERLVESIVEQQPTCVLHAVLIAIGVLLNTLSMPKLSVRVHQRVPPVGQATVDLVAPSPSSGDVVSILSIADVTARGFVHPMSAPPPARFFLDHASKPPAMVPEEAASKPRPWAHIAAVATLPTVLREMWSHLDRLLADECGGGGSGDADGVSTSSDLIHATAAAMQWRTREWRALALSGASAYFCGPFGLLSKQFFAARVSSCVGQLPVSQAAATGCVLPPSLGVGASNVWVSAVDLEFPLELCVSATSSTPVAFRVSYAAHEKKSQAVKDAEQAAVAALFPAVKAHMGGVPSPSTLPPVDWVGWFPPPLSLSTPSLSSAPSKPDPSPGDLDRTARAIEALARRHHRPGSPHSDRPPPHRLPTDRSNGGGSAVVSGGRVQVSPEEVTAAAAAPRVVLRRPKGATD